MKIGIISDSHGSFAFTKKAVQYLKNEGVGLIVHLGDVLYHGPRNPIPPFYDPPKLAEFLKGAEDLIVLRGNCDSDVDEMVMEKRFLEGMAVFLDKDRLAVLGHIKEDVADLPGNVFIYGHTHIPKVERKDGKIYLNPGSVSLPKDGNPPTFVMLDLERKIGVFISVENLSTLRMFPLT